MFPRRLLVGLAAVALACKSDPISPPVDGCTGDGSSPLTLAVYQGATIPAAQVGECLELTGGRARYLIVPQFATRDDAGSSAGTTSRSFELGAAAGGGPVAALVPEVGRPTAASAQQRLDYALRRRESDLAPLAASIAAERRRGGGPTLAVRAAAGTLNFQVLAKLDGSRFETVTADLKFTGDNILVYVDRQAPSGGFTDLQLERLGRLFDQKLYGIAVGAFGNPSDIDGNGRVMVLLTPVVNRMTTAAECAQFGYVTGFFYGLDLTPTRPNSNRGELFYSVVPDPSGATGSCAHDVAEVEQMIPSTFIHELQHMISWNQHVLVRGGRDEELWLNEGMSHMAEELASLAYERDPTQRRSTPGQLFPDSSQGFIVSNVGNAYRFLSDPHNTSLTLFRDYGSLEERGAAWLFMRWLVDQKGEQILRRLSESSRTGVANVEDRAGEPFRRLFGDFGIAVYADGLPGTDRSLLPARYRFASRDFRRIFQRFHDLDPNQHPVPFPVVPRVLAPGGSDARSMLPGAMTWYTLSTAGAPAPVSLRFTASGGEPFADALGAQVGILRLPDGP